MFSSIKWDTSTVENVLWGFSGKIPPEAGANVFSLTMNSICSDSWRGRGWGVAWEGLSRVLGIWEAVSGHASRFTAPPHKLEKAPPLSRHRPLDSPAWPWLGPSEETQLSSF